MFRKSFSRYGEILEFYIQIKNGVFEGLCDCLCTHFFEWIEDKFKHSLLEHSTQSQISQSYVLRSWERTEHEKTEEANSFNVSAQCRLLTKSVSCLKCNTMSY